MRSPARALAAAALLAAAAIGQQDAAATTGDWPQEVLRACTSPRYGLRLAASKKVARGGDAAVPAIRAFAQEHGMDAVPVALVEAIAEGGGDGEAMLGLVLEWATDREFFWRGQAMKGLALRAAASEPLRNRFQPTFAAFASDPAWLVRAHATYGLRQAPRDFSVEEAQSQQISPPERDPRAATRIAALLGDQRALVAALGDERTFLGDAWGKRRATEAFQALKKLRAKDWGYRPEADVATNAAAIAAIAQELGAPAPEHRVDPPQTFTGGFEVLSCRNGDFFLRWTEDGTLAGGDTPECAVTCRIAAPRWSQLSAKATAIELPAQSGVVICDKMRIQLTARAAQAAVAPAALPEAAADWLKQLAAAIEEAGAIELASTLRARLGQFVVR